MTIKSITQNGLDLVLSQVEEGFLITLHKDGSMVVSSEPIRDYNMASFLFDMKMEETFNHYGELQ